MPALNGKPMAVAQWRARMSNSTAFYSTGVKKSACLRRIVANTSIGSVWKTSKMAKVDGDAQ
jgi:hypothetical protein